jgi:hypothetical protein
MLSRIDFFCSLLRLYILYIIVRLKADNKKAWRAGQVLLEYGTTLVLIIAALIAIQRYVQRGLQAGYKDATVMVLEGNNEITGIRQAIEALPETVKANLSPLPKHLQYEPYYRQSKITTVSGTKGAPNSTTTNYFSGGGGSDKTIDETTSRTGSRTELPWVEEEDDEEEEEND